MNLEPKPASSRAALPPLMSQKMQGKQPVPPGPAPGPRRIKPLPRDENKMAVDFYIASMLNEQVKMLMQREDGTADLTRVPTPYREFLSITPTPEHLVRRGQGEDDLDEGEEETVGSLEYTMECVEKFLAYVWAQLASMMVFKKKTIAADVEMGPVGTGTPQGRVFTIQGNTPDTPGSQATPRGDIPHAPNSYFPPVQSHQ